MKWLRHTWARLAKSLPAPAVAALAVAIGVHSPMALAAPRPEESVAEALRPFIGEEAAGSLADTVARLSAAMMALDAMGETAAEETKTRALDAAVDIAAPLLQQWIVASRDEAVAEGVEPIPDAVRETLSGFFSASLLKGVRYRVGWGSSRTLQGHVFRFHGTKAITLGNIIVFRDAEVAADPLIWAHELAHVQQYKEWGLKAFSERYIRDFQGVEGDAWRTHGRYKSWAQRHGLIAPTDPATMWERD